MAVPQHIHGPTLGVTTDATQVTEHSHTEAHVRDLGLAVRLSGSKNMS